MMSSSAQAHHPLSGRSAHLYTLLSSQICVCGRGVYRARARTFVFRFAGLACLDIRTLYIDAPHPSLVLRKLTRNKGSPALAFLEFFVLALKVY